MFLKIILEYIHWLQQKNKKIRKDKITLGRHFEFGFSRQTTKMRMYICKKRDGDKKEK